MSKKPISISIISLFPEIVEQYTRFGIIARAIAGKLLTFSAANLRSFSFDKRGTVDDRPYGGGVGMVLRPDVVYAAIKKTAAKRNARVILLTPQGKKFTHAHAKRLATYHNLVFVCGRYEGFDERIRKFVDEEMSIGDYVLMGGELPALVITEAVLRHVPGVLGKDESAVGESFVDGVLEHPQYTKPEVWEVNGKKLRVPKILLSGDHAKVNDFRKQESQKRTKKRRPDLLVK